MPLASRIAFQFDQGVQSRGFGLFKGRAVRVLEQNYRHLQALVTGGRLYEVRVTHEAGRLLVFCECPYFVEYGTCKHLWATILEADRIGALAGALDATYLKLEDDLSFDRDGGDIQDSDRSDPLPDRFRLTPPPPLRIPAWQEQLAAIQRDIEQKKTRVVAWPRDFEISYVIDLAASKASGTVVIELSSRTRRKNREWSGYKGVKITSAQIGSLRDPADVDIVAAMLGAQEYYSYHYQHYSGGAAIRRALPAALALKLIPAIAGTGRL